MSGHKGLNAARVFVRENIEDQVPGQLSTWATEIQCCISIHCPGTSGSRISLRIALPFFLVRVNMAKYSFSFHSRFIEDSNRSFSDLVEWEILYLFERPRGAQLYFYKLPLF